MHLSSMLEMGPPSGSLMLPVRSSLWWLAQHLITRAPSSSLLPSPYFGVQGGRQFDGQAALFSILEDHHFNQHLCALELVSPKLTPKVLDWRETVGHAQDPRCLLLHAQLTTLADASH